MELGDWPVAFWCGGDEGYSGNCVEGRGGRREEWSGGGGGGGGGGGTGSGGGHGHGFIR